MIPGQINYRIQEWGADIRFHWWEQDIHDNVLGINFRAAKLSQDLIRDELNRDSDRT